MVVRWAATWADQTVGTMTDAWAYMTVARLAAERAAQWVVERAEPWARMWVGGSAVKMDNATAECLVAKMVDVSVALTVEHLVACSVATKDFYWAAVTVVQMGHVRVVSTGAATAASLVGCWVAEMVAGKAYWKAVTMAAS